MFFNDALIEMHDASVRLMVTLTTRAELRALGESHSAAAVVAKRFETLKYEAPPTSPSDLVPATALANADEDEGDDEGEPVAVQAPSSFCDPDPVATKVAPSNAALRQRRRRKARREALRGLRSIQAARNKIERANEQLERERKHDYKETDRTLLHLVKQFPGQYILAIQDRFLRSELRKLPGALVIYERNGLLHYENPSKATLLCEAKAEAAKALPSAREQQM